MAEQTTIRVRVDERFACSRCVVSFVAETNILDMVEFESISRTTDTIPIQDPVALLGQTPQQTVSTISKHNTKHTNPIHSHTLEHCVVECTCGAALDWHCQVTTGAATTMAW
jgi:hypothetical protein